jgi:hypothetical protein
MRRFTLAVASLAGLAALTACAGPSGNVPEGGATTTSGAAVTSSPAPEPTPTAGSSVPASNPPPEITPSATTDPATGEVTVTGTVEAGVEPGCLLLEGYLLMDGDPAVIQPGRRVRVTGNETEIFVSYCQQGRPFLVTSAELA